MGAGFGGLGGVWRGVGGCVGRAVGVGVGGWVFGGVDHESDAAFLECEHPEKTNNKTLSRVLWNAHVKWPLAVGENNILRKQLCKLHQR